jgi:hypothetical protein
MRSNITPTIGEEALCNEDIFPLGFISRQSDLSTNRKIDCYLIAVFKAHETDLLALFEGIATYELDNQRGKLKLEKTEPHGRPQV